MKKIVVIAVLLIAVLLVAPWSIGQLAEKRVNAGLDKLVETAPYLTIVERKWTRGWFRSEQEVTFELFGPWLRNMTANAVLDELKKAGEASEGAAPAEAAAAPAEAPAVEAPAAQAAPVDDKPLIPPLRFTVRNEILHGPVLWPASLGIARVNTRLVLSEEIRKKLMEVFGTDEPVRVRTRVGFFGGGTTRLFGEGRTIKFNDKPGSFAYDDFKLDIGYSANLDDIDLDGSWPRLEGGSQGEKVLVKDMTLTSRSERVRGDLYDGNFKFLIDEIQVTNPSSAATSISDLRYVVAAKTDGDFMGITASLGSGKVRNKELEAIKFNLDEIHYDFSLQRLHAPTLEKLMVEMKKVYTQPLTDVAALDQAFSGPFKQYGMELLKYDPEFVIDRIGVVTPDGEGMIKGVIKLKGVTPQDIEMGSMAMIGKIEADLTVSVAQKLVDSIPNGNTGVGAAIDAGYARRDGDKIVSHIEFRKGELKINGKAQGIPGLGGPPAATEGMPPEGEVPAVPQE